MLDLKLKFVPKKSWFSPRVFLESSCFTKSVNVIDAQAINIVKRVLETENGSLQLRRFKDIVDALGTFHVIISAYRYRPLTKQLNTNRSEILH